MVNGDPQSQDHDHVNIPGLWQSKPNTSQVTLRSTIVGLAIGSLVLFSNFQFGLQTGWVSMMGLPSSFIAFAIFKALHRHLTDPYTDVENVYAQSLAVAVGTGPLAFGLVGVIPAIEKFLTGKEAGIIDSDDNWHLKLSIGQLMIFCSGLAFFGVFFAVLLRRQIIIKEQLRFPSGSATAALISVLHRSEIKRLDIGGISEDHYEAEGSYRRIDQNHVQSETTDIDYKNNIKLLGIAFCASATYTIVVYFIPFLRELPIFGTYLAKSYLWTFQPSPAYIGQGIIMGLPTVSSMLFGAILGWGILAPIANHFNWVSGPIDDWKTGGQGWILWIGLSIMMVDTAVSFLVFVAKSIRTGLDERKKTTDDGMESSQGTAWTQDTQDTEWTQGTRGTQGTEWTQDTQWTEGTESTQLEVNEDANSSNLVPTSVAAIGLGISMIFCIGAVRAVFGSIVPIYALIIAVILAVLLSILGVRALGETDLNPVSGIGKISQVIFAVVVPPSHPGSVLINLIAGAVTEAGAQQAGDLMQDLKTGHLLGASPRAQFIAQMIGSTWSIFLSAAVYRLYDAVYDIPGSLFRIPTALVWIDCSRLVSGSGFPPKAGLFALGLSIIFGILALFKAIFKTKSISQWIPSGIAVGIGIYNSPSFTLARFVGGCIAAWFISRHEDHKSLVKLIILASGLVLGEGVFSIFSLVLTGMGVPHL